MERGIGMTTNLKIKETESTQGVWDETSILDGAGVDTFTSGSVSVGSQMLTGDAVEMFTTSCIEAPQSLSASAGEGVQMFTTSCITASSDQTRGEMVELFTTSC